MHKLESTNTTWIPYICLSPPKIHGGTKKELASSTTELHIGDNLWEPEELEVQVMC